MTASTNNQASSAVTTPRERRDRLEILTSLLNGPSVHRRFRDVVIQFDADDPVYGWACEVPDCVGISHGQRLCNTHEVEWRPAMRAGSTRASFLEQAKPLLIAMGAARQVCRICPDRPAHIRHTQLCASHHSRWGNYLRNRPSADLEEWAAGQPSLPGFGSCTVRVCPELASGVVGLCTGHHDRYFAAGRPGGVSSLPVGSPRGRAIKRTVDDAVAFRRWCEQENPLRVRGTVNLAGLQPVVRHEIAWGLMTHAQRPNASPWDCAAIQLVVNACRADNHATLFDLPGGEAGIRALIGKMDTRVGMILSWIVPSLRTIYYTVEESREAGFISAEHFGRQLKATRGYFDLGGVTQDWLRLLAWEYMASLFRSPKCPRTRGPFDTARRAVIELSAYLDSAPGQGHDAAALDATIAHGFVADQRHREANKLRALGVSRTDGQPSIVSETTRRLVFNGVRSMMRFALESSLRDELGLRSDFALAFPVGGPNSARSRRPFPDDVAKVLADPQSLDLLADLDLYDRGLRDLWITIVYTGRRCGEVLSLRLDCTSRYGGLPVLWHDQTKVGNFNAAVRIPEALMGLLEERRKKSLVFFEHLNGRAPTTAERAEMALFPSRVSNPYLTKPLSYGNFSYKFRQWVRDLDLGPQVPHQARHTLATRLMRAGASVTQVRAFLGHVSDRMAETYLHVAHSDLDDTLAAVWVSGPGSKEPGTLLSSANEPMGKHRAMQLALDLSRTSTPTTGGFCTFQPVVQGNACPRNLDCENCDKFVLSGADLVYWRRKQEQWRSLAERAQDDATAEYLHRVFEPTAQAIRGLESALSGLGLLDEALALDLRRPQDYFHRIWSMNFRAEDLLKHADGPIKDGERTA